MNWLKRLAIWLAVSLSDLVTISHEETCKCDIAPGGLSGWTMDRSRCPIHWDGR